MPKEPKITKFVVKDSIEGVEVKQVYTSCDVCGNKKMVDCIGITNKLNNEVTDLCLPCIKGLSEVAKELK